MKPGDKVLIKKGSLGPGPIEHLEEVPGCVSRVEPAKIVVSFKTGETVVCCEYELCSINNAETT